MDSRGASLASDPQSPSKFQKLERKTPSPARKSPQLLRIVEDDDLASAPVVASLPRSVKVSPSPASHRRLSSVSERSSAVNSPSRVPPGAASDRSYPSTPSRSPRAIRDPSSLSSDSYTGRTSPPVSYAGRSAHGDSSPRPARGSRSSSLTPDLDSRSSPRRSHSPFSDRLSGSPLSRNGRLIADAGLDSPTISYSTGPSLVASPFRDLDDISKAAGVAPDDPDEILDRLLDEAEREASPKRLRTPPSALPSPIAYRNVSCQTPSRRSPGSRFSRGLHGSPSPARLSRTDTPESVRRTASPLDSFEPQPRPQQQPCFGSSQRIPIQTPNRIIPAASTRTSRPGSKTITPPRNGMAGGTQRHATTSTVNQAPSPRTRLAQTLAEIQRDLAKTRHGFEEMEERLRRREVPSIDSKTSVSVAAAKSPVKRPWWARAQIPQADETLMSVHAPSPVRKHEVDLFDRWSPPQEDRVMSPAMSRYSDRSTVRPSDQTQTLASVDDDGAGSDDIGDCETNATTDTSLPLFDALDTSVSKPENELASLTPELEKVIADLLDALEPSIPDAAPSIEQPGTLSLKNPEIACRVAQLSLLAVLCCELALLAV